MSGAVEKYCIPTNLQDALTILAEEGDAASIVAGGTVPGLRQATRIKTLVDILRCGLETIEITDKKVRFGATVTPATLAAMPELDTIGSGILREAASAIAPLAVRNQVTLGGNLVGVLSTSDLPVALLALGGEVQIAKADSKPRSLTVDALFDANPRKLLERGEVITAIEIQRPPAKAAGAYMKLSQTVSDLALVNAAVLLDIDNGVCRSARIAIGAVRPRAFRANAAEETLVGQKITDDLLARAAETASIGVSISTDLRASTEHRQRLLRVAVRRSLTTAWRRSRGEQPYKAPRRIPPPAWSRKGPGSEVGRLLTARVDGIERRIPIKPDELLLDVLRRDGIVSVKRGCDEGYCGTCAVSIDGRLINACVTLAAQVEGCEITTAAGIGSIFEPHAVQSAFVDEGAVQCGFCTPGMVVAAKTLLDNIPNPDESEVKEALDGNLCRCTGYVKPLKAVQEAAKAMRKEQTRRGAR